MNPIRRFYDYITGFPTPRRRERFFDEGPMKKGGVNEPPDTPRPTEPPKPQDPAATPEERRELRDRFRRHLTAAVNGTIKAIEQEERHRQNIERRLRRLERAANARHRDRRRAP